MYFFFSHRKLRGRSAVPPTYILTSIAGEPGTVNLGYILTHILHTSHTYIHSGQSIVRRAHLAPSSACENRSGLLAPPKAEAQHGLHGLHGLADPPFLGPRVHPLTSPHQGALCLGLGVAALDRLLSAGIFLTAAQLGEQGAGPTAAAEIPVARCSLPTATAH